MEEFNIIFSKQAEILIDNMQDFNKNDFMNWYKQQIFEVGSKNILEYLIQKDNNNGS